MNKTRHQMRLAMWALVLVLLVQTIAVTIPSNVAYAQGMDRNSVVTKMEENLILKSDGTVWAWGDNNFGQIGNGTFQASDYPEQIKSLSNVIDISMESSVSLALKKDGTVWSWGAYNMIAPDDGTLLGSINPIPVQVQGISDVKAIVAGTASGFALKSDGTVWSWGLNMRGELGNGTYRASENPTQVKELSDVVAIESHSTNLFALKSDGTVWAVGDNTFKQLGTAVTRGFHNVPVQINGLDNVKAIRSYGSKLFAIKNDGTLWALGANQYGEIGVNANTEKVDVPVQIPLPLPVVQVQIGGMHAEALLSDGTVWAWGSNSNNALANGERDLKGNERIDTPAQVKNLKNVKRLIATSVAEKQDGTVWTWGSVYLTFYKGSMNITKEPVQAYWDTIGVLAPDAFVKPKPYNPADVTLLPSQAAKAARNYDNVAIAAGWDTSLALKSDGTVWQWSINGYSQSDLSTAILAETPVQVPGLTNIKAISISWKHALALKSDGTVWQWGINEDSKCSIRQYQCLGTSKVPTQVPNLTDVVQIAAGTEHMLALKSDGSVWAWGLNDKGQLGYGTTTSSATPVQVSGLSNVESIAAADDASGVVKKDGTVWVWGDNFYGQLLGNTGKLTFTTTPTQITQLSGVKALQLNWAHNVALMKDGSIWTWGLNDYGYLGDGTWNKRETPAKISGASNVKSIASDNYTLALRNDGTLLTWGLSVGSDDIASTTPIPIEGITNVKAVAAGVHHGLILLDDGSIWDLGQDGYYGRQPVQVQWVPIEIPGFFTGSSPDSSIVVPPTSSTTNDTDFVMVEAGDVVSAALKKDGTVWHWGLIINREQPVQVQGLSNVKSISVGRDFVLAVKQDGTVWAWGNNDMGQFGDQSLPSSDIPVQVKGLSNVKEVNAGYSYSRAVKNDGTVWVWNVNWYNDDYSQFRLTQVRDMNDITSIFTEFDTSMVVNSDGTIYRVFGLGTGMLPEPVVYTEIPSIKAIYEGGLGTTILDAQGNVWQWENNTSPQKVTGLTNIVSISKGLSHTLALKGDGTVWAWGDNYSGQLGDGTMIDRDKPIQVSGLKDVVMISAGDAHSLALTSDGKVWGWGDNDFGQLGTDDRKEVLVATPISLGTNALEPDTTTDVPTTVVASPTKSQVLINNKPVAFEAYNINNNNYFKLRDLAAALGQTEKSFEVVWDSKANSIKLYSNKPYTKVGGELVASTKTTKKTATLTRSSLLLDDQSISLTAYQINGNNYFKLRDIAALFDFGVTWNGAKNMIEIETNKSYVSE